MRATTNRDLPSLLGFGERGITMQKTIHVAAPVEQVFAFWTDYQNFLRFMHNVREVRPVSENRPHWVAGPAGVPVQDRGGDPRGARRADRVVLGPRL